MVTSRIKDLLYFCNRNLESYRTILSVSNEETWIIHRIRYINTQCYGTKKIVQTAGRTQLGEFAPKFAHLAFEVPGENSSNEWLEPVIDEEYNKLK